MAAGSKSRNTHDSEISKSTVVLSVLANLNCEIVDMMWLHSVLILIDSIYHHASIFHNIL